MQLYNLEISQRRSFIVRRLRSISLTSARCRAKSIFWVSFASLALLTAVIPAERPQAAETIVTRRLIREQFNQFDLDYPGRRLERLAQLAEPEKRLFDLQGQGHSMACSAQILNETRWILNSTAQFARADKNLWLLSISLGHPQQDFALNQDDHAGDWGICYDEPFKKLDPMITALNELARTRTPPTHGALAFLVQEHMSSPRAMTDYLTRIRISDIAREGINRRDELGAVAAVLSELLFKQDLRDYMQRYIAGGDNFSRFAETFKNFIVEWQDPKTGFWGPWYRSGSQILKGRDLSFTYHIIAYLNGDVDRWDRIVKTMLAIKDEEYPFGWLQLGRLTNHHAYDVARIFKIGWPHMDDASRAQVSQAMDDVLARTLRDGINKDGSVTPVFGFSSGIDDDYYYAVSFLTTTGYCSAGRLFWSTREAPEAAGLCCDLAARLDALGSGTARLQAARARLRKTNPVCPGERNGSDALLPVSERSWSDEEATDDAAKAEAQH
jgi:hypothetical protein